MFDGLLQFPSVIQVQFVGSVNWQLKKCLCEKYALKKEKQPQVLHRNVTLVIFFCKSKVDGYHLKDAATIAIPSFL